MQDTYCCHLIARTAWLSICEASSKRCDQFVIVDRIYHCQHLFSCKSDLKSGIAPESDGYDHMGECQCLQDYEYLEKQILTRNFSMLIWGLGMNIICL